MRSSIAWALVMVSLGAGGTYAATTDLVATADNTLYESATGALSNGAGSYLFAGENDNSQRRRAVLRFDLAPIPAGSVITSVELHLSMSRTRAATTDVAVHRLLSDWGEGSSIAAGEEGGGGPSTIGDATWIHTSYDTARWTLAGGDFVMSASATRAIAGVGPYSFASTATLVADAQGWLDGTTANYGFIVIGDETGAKTAKRFDSRTHATTANRPRLTVTYTAPIRGACCDAGGGCTTVDPALCTGTYQGDGTTCGAGGRCGACCDAASCAYRVDASCTLYRGDGTSCSPDPCAAPILGACCQSDGSCAEVEATACVGTYQGDLTTCDTGSTCGSCCNGTTCSLRVPGSCAGTYGGAGSSCSPNPCFTAPSGACCFGNTCEDATTRSSCEVRSGDYQGDAQSCSTAPCDSESRACCYAGERCVVMNRDVCDATGGDRQGGGSTCANNPCAAIGACCLATSCVPDTTHDDCEAMGGDYEGGIGCTATTCGEARACCLGGQPCTILDERTCDAMGGQHLPRGVGCSPDPCGATPCDASLIGTIDGLTAVKSNAGRDVSLSFRADPAANGYNVWYVALKTDIPVATSLGPATVVPGCRNRATPDCVHLDGVAESAGSRLFYNVLGACDGIEAAR